MILKYIGIGAIILLITFTSGCFENKSGISDSDRPLFEDPICLHCEKANCVYTGIKTINGEKNFEYTCPKCGETQYDTLKA